MVASMSKNELDNSKVTYRYLVLKIELTIVHSKFLPSTSKISVI